MSHSPGGQAGGLAIRGQPQRPRGQIEEEEEEEEEDPAHNAHNNDDDVSNNPSGSTESPSEGNNNSASEEVEHNKPSKVLAESGITYNVARLGVDSLARALVGLTGRFDVVDCFTTQSGFGFCLLERPLVHVGKDSRYSCSCVSFGNRPDLACQHVFWLIDQLRGFDFGSQRPNDEVPLSSDGHSAGFFPPEELLENNLDTVADRFGWQYTGNETPSGGPNLSRPQRVRDVMSAFSTTTLPEDFRPDLAERHGADDQLRTPEQCVVQGDFEATMFRLAIHDDGVYASLSKTMPMPACAAIYFDKIQEKSRKLLADFDRYCHSGQAPADGSSVDVGDVIDRLRLHAHRVKMNITTRYPHGTKGAATALISLLENVSNRNKDALEGNIWGRVSFSGEDEDQRNLFHQLIGVDGSFSHSQSHSQSRSHYDYDYDPNSFFILDALDILPDSELGQFVSSLRRILQRIEVNRAPKPYIRRLAALVRAAESGSREPAAAAATVTTATGAAGGGVGLGGSSSSSPLAQKRPASGSSGWYKRTR